METHRVLSLCVSTWLHSVCRPRQECSSGSGSQSERRADAQFISLWKSVSVRTMQQTLKDVDADMDICTFALCVCAARGALAWFL